MPRYLTDKDIADFRAELCKVATERFARHGYEGVTMRQLAEALGCSPKTPYRYFKDKADILATVRAEAFTKFANALEQAAAGGKDPMERARRVGGAYLRFAEEHPHAYRIMFEIDQPIDHRHPDLGPPAKRSRQMITRQAEDLVAAGVVDVDARLLGWAMWAATHGVVMLHQAGMLAGGPDLRALSQFIGTLMMKGAVTSGTKSKGGKK
jgi:AcrR family transcriptional regulator